MNEMIQSSLSNIAIIFLMHLFNDILIKNRKKYPLEYFPFGMIGIISLAVIAMFYLPIQYGGFQFDLRIIPLTLFAYKWGFRYVFPVLIITSLWRIGLGGENLFTGIMCGMFLPVAAGLFFRKMIKKAPAIKPHVLFSLLFSAWLMSDLPIVFALPNGWELFQEIFLIRLFSVMLTGFTLNFFIQNTEKELQMKEKLEYYAERDPLTGLYNMRFFETHIRRYSSPKKYHYIIMIDIDHFKLINDTYGHLTGDYILKCLAEIIAKKVSKNKKIDCILGRYGGEEFIAFAATSFKRDVIHLVEDIRQEIEKTTFHSRDKKNAIHLTVSMGVSGLADCSHLQKAIEQADKSLYKSKRNGRNQVNYA